MENIFEGAKFGEYFKTQNNKKVVFLGYSHLKNYAMCCIKVKEDDKAPHDFLYNLDGTVKSVIYHYTTENEKNEYKIVSKYIEPIDEEKLDKLAIDYSHGNYFLDDDIINAYKAGYRKAMEE